MRAYNITVCVLFVRARSVWKQKKPSEPILGDTYHCFLLGRSTPAIYRISESPAFSLTQQDFIDPGAKGKRKGKKIYVRQYPQGLLRLLWRGSEQIPHSATVITLHSEIQRHPLL